MNPDLPFRKMSKARTAAFAVKQNRPSLYPQISNSDLLNHIVKVGKVFFNSEMEVHQTGKVD